MSSTRRGRRVLPTPAGCVTVDRSGSGIRVYLLMHHPLVVTLISADPAAPSPLPTPSVTLYPQHRVGPVSAGTVWSLLENDWTTAATQPRAAWLS